MQDQMDLYAIFNLITDLVVIAERDSAQIVFANDAIVNLTGYSQDHLTHLTLTDLYPALAEIDLATTLPAPTPYALRLIGSDGFWCAAEARFDYQTIHDTDCIVCTAVCVTDLAADVHLLARELHEQRTIYRALITGIFDLFFRIRRDGTYVDFKIPSKTGLYEPETVDEIIGRNVSEVVPPDVTEIVMPVIERVIDTRKPEAVEYQIVEKTERHFYEAIFAASLRDEIVAVVRDVTGIRRNEAVLRHQRDLSAALSRNIALDEALKLVLKTSIDVSQMDYGGIYLIDPTMGGALVLAEHWGLSEGFIERAAVYAPDSPQTRMITDGQAVYINFSDMPFPTNEEGLPEVLRAFALIPIHTQQEIIGCISLASNHFDVDDIHETTRDALETIAFDSGSAIVRMRTQEQLCESEELARTLINAPADTAILVDHDNIILAINEAGAQLLNAPVDELIGQCILDFVPPNSLEDRIKRTERIFLTAEPERFEDTSEGIHYFITYYPVLDAQKNVSQLAIFTRDITREKQSAEALIKRDRLLEAVAQASSRLLAANELVNAIDEVLELLGKATQASDVYIFENHMHPRSGKPAISQRYFWTASGVYRETARLQMQNQEWQKNGLDVWYDTLRVGGMIAGTLADIPQPARDRLASAGVKSLLLVPIFVERNNFWGFIGFDDQQEKREWLSEEISILRLMATSTGAAIKRQLVEENLRRERAIADTLREVGMVLTSTLDLGEVLERILQQANRVVPYDSANVMLIEDGLARIEVGTGYEKVGLNSNKMRGTTFQLDQTPILRTIVDTCESYLCPDVAKDNRWVYRSDALWVKSWLGMPIISRDKVVGIFVLDAHVTDFYNTTHLKLIQPFVEQAAIAFENASLFAETQSLEHIKSKMIRIASHDLRNPLTRIQKAILAFKQDENHMITLQHLKACDQIAEASLEMELIISNILSVERIEAQHQAAQALDWCHLIDKSLEMVHTDLAAKNHTVTVECDDDLPGTRGDPIQLQRAVVNLLGNAIKFTPPGGTITVNVYAKPYGFEQTVAVEVEDNGIGIPKEQQIDLYTPFYRAQHSKEIDGTGLGLSIVKTAVEHHQGNVYFKSTPGKGSMFGFWIPAHNSKDDT